MCTTHDCLHQAVYFVGWFVHLQEYSESCGKISWNFVKVQEMIRLSVYESFFNLRRCPASSGINRNRKSYYIGKSTYVRKRYGITVTTPCVVSHGGKQIWSEMICWIVTMEKRNNHEVNCGNVQDRDQFNKNWYDDCVDLNSFDTINNICHVVCMYIVQLMNTSLAQQWRQTTQCNTR